MLVSLAFLFFFYLLTLRIIFWGMGREEKQKKNAQRPEIKNVSRLLQLNALLKLTQLELHHRMIAVTTAMILCQNLGCVLILASHH